MRETLVLVPRKHAVTQAAPAGIEKHYRVKDLVEITGYSGRTVRRLFSGEPDVLVLPRKTKRGSSAYRAIAVPESVVRRVLNRLRQAA